MKPSKCFVYSLTLAFFLYSLFPNGECRAQDKQVFVKIREHVLRIINHSDKALTTDGIGVYIDDIRCDVRQIICGDTQHVVKTTSAVPAEPETQIPPIAAPSVASPLILVVDISSLYTLEIEKSYPKIQVVIRTLKEWLDKQVALDRSVAIIQIDFSTRLLADFTDDREKLVHALEEITSLVANRMRSTSVMTQEFEGPHADDPSDLEFKRLLRNLFSTFENLASVLNEGVPPADVVLFSFGHIVYTDRDAGYLPEFHRSIRKLVSAGCRVNTISLAGVHRDPKETKLTSEEESLFMFAHETGGMFMTGRSDLGAALDEVLVGLGRTCLVHIRLDPSVKPGFHSLRIESNQPGVSIRHATGIWIHELREN